MERIEDRINKEPMRARDRFVTTADQCETGQPYQHEEIGWAIKQMYHGLKVRRRGWNGPGMWLALQVPDQHSKMSLPYIYMSTVQGGLVPWLASQTDLLATDWEIATV
jgi:hypothetical protein